MSFLAPLYLLLLGLSVPILLLWFLRQKREPRVVPTVFLWRKAAEEERVSPLLKNLTKSILLLLQLAALLLLSAGAAGAVLNLRLGGEARRVVILLDRSASMSTVEADGRTRLELAREKAVALIDTFRRGDEGMLIAFDSRARILSGFTGEFPSLRRLVLGVRANDLPTEPAEALRVAAARTASVARGRLEVFLFSDGAFPPLEEEVEGLSEARFAFVGVGEVRANCGITSVDVVADLEGEAKLFPRLANAGPDPVTRTLVLERGDAVLDAWEVDLPARSAEGRAIDLSAIPPGPLVLRLTPEDAFAADDRAYFVLRENPVRRILIVTDGNPVLARLKDFHPRVEVYSVHPDEAADAVAAGGDRFDLVIFDGVAPEGVVPGTGILAPSAVYLDCVPPGGEVVLADRIVDPPLVDWDRSHPLNREVDWAEVNVHRASPVSAPPASTALLEATGGPLVTVLPGPGLTVVFGFRIQDSNLPLRLAFPIFFANVLERAFQHDAGGEAGLLHTGGVLTRPLPPGAAEAKVTTPGGRTVPVKALPDGTASFAGTERAGFYTFAVEGPGGFEEQVAFTLASDQEADVAPRPAIEIGGRQSASEPEAIETNYPLTGPLVLIGLAVLLLEWFLWLGGSARRSRRKPSSGGFPFERG